MDRGRGGFRGRGGGHRGDNGGGGRGGGRGGGPGGYQGNRAGGEGGDRKSREAILDLAKYLDKAIALKFTGGREGSWFHAREKMDLGLIATGVFSCGHIEGV